MIITPPNLNRLLLLRSIAIGCEIIALILAIQFLHINLPLLPIALVIALHFVINIVIWRRIRHLNQVSPIEFTVQLALDTVVLTLLLYFSGGYTNPFVSLFLLPLIITASIMPQRHTWVMAMITIGCYTTLMFYYTPLPTPISHMSHQGSEFDLHVLGMWFSFLLSVGLVVFFMVRMANSMRERDQALARAREKALHDEHLVELGTLATGAAHELGTPLATMAVVSSELKYDHANDPDIVEKIDIFRDQLNRCKAIISDISASTGQARAEGGSSVAIDDYLRGVIDQWQMTRPRASAKIELHGSIPAPHILTDKALTQAIINVLNNAADATPDYIEIDADWDSQQFILNVLDNGSGLTASAQKTAGQPYFTTKPEGLGLGLFLSRAVIERYSGSLELSNRPEGGARARLILPITGLRI